VTLLSTINLFLRGDSSAPQSFSHAALLPPPLSLASISNLSARPRAMSQRSELSGPDDAVSVLLSYQIDEADAQIVGGGGSKLMSRDCGGNANESALVSAHVCYAEDVHLRVRSSARLFKFSANERRPSYPPLPPD
jgi:hypothetical protein